MKKSIFLLKDLQRISRNELRKIAGGAGECSGCSPFFVLEPPGEPCGFRGPSEQICSGVIVNSRCCVIEL